MLLWCSFFFFFKQKTAYEMRISDWSPDVCPSDLKPQIAARQTGMLLHQGLRAGSLSTRDRFDNAAMLILGNEQDAVRLRHGRLRHDEAARRRERQGRRAFHLPLQRRADRKTVG